MLRRIWNSTRSLFSRKGKIYVNGYSVELLGYIDELYSMFETLNYEYVFECSKGKCVSYINTSDRDSVEILSLASGLKVASTCIEQECGRIPVLLPPPYEDTAFRVSAHGKPSDGVLLGYTMDAPFFLNINDLFKHIAIIGSTGSGKTHTAARIAQCSHLHGVKVVVLDWHSEYAKIIDDKDIEATLPEISISNVGSIEEYANMLEKALSLSPQQVLVLTSILEAVTSRSIEQAINALSRILMLSTRQVHSVPKDAIGDSLHRLAERALRARSMFDLLDLLYELYEYKSSLYDMSRGEKEVWSALLRRIAILAYGSKAIKLLGDGNSSLDWLDSERITVIDLSPIRSLLTRKIYALLVLYTIFNYVVHNGTNTVKNLLAVVEEAYNYVDIGAQIIETLLTEARKYNLGLVLVTHTPRILTYQAEANINTLIIHRVSSSSDLKELRVHILGDEYVPLIASLKPGLALVTSADITPPSIITIPSTKEGC